MYDLIIGTKSRDGKKSKIDYLSLANLPTPFDGLWVSPSEGLEYTLSDDGTYYICSGIGYCTDYVVYIPETHNGKPVKSIRGVRAERIVIPSSFEEIPANAFMSDQYEEKTTVSCKVIGENLKTVGSGAFYCNSYLKKVILPDSVTVINSLAFASTGLRRFNFPPNLQIIGGSAFSGVPLSGKISIPNSVKTIAGWAFSNLSGLDDKEVVIGSGVESIGEQAFSISLSLKKVTMKCKSPTIGANAFSNCNDLVEINVAWAQGAVAGAPWGATKATINYNYKGE